MGYNSSEYELLKRNMVIMLKYQYFQTLMINESGINHYN